jgi:deoxyribonuclease I
MKFLAALLITAFSLTAFAQQDQKLPDGKWAYYGEEFYVTLASRRGFERTLFNRIFNESHVSKPGKFDQISTQCAEGGSCYRHTSVGYDRARIIMFGELDVLTDTKGTYVVDVYCGKKFYFKRPEEVSSMSAQVNIEHTWPQSKFNGNYKKDMQKSDMHHLYPSDSHANSVRGNNPFGFVSASEDSMGGEGCRASRMGMIDDVDVYTPPKNHRGNVARALFYFSMHYNLGISKAEEMILREWHKIDPIDDAEIVRHEKIAKHQKVRNPFVDHPELVERIADF